MRRGTRQYVEKYRSKLKACIAEIDDPGEQYYDGNPFYSAENRAALVRALQSLPPVVLGRFAARKRGRK